MDSLAALFCQNPGVERLLRPYPDELEGLEESIRTLRHLVRGDPSNQDIRFQYAATLISHSRLSYVEEGVHLMDELAFDGLQQVKKLAAAESQSSPTGSSVVKPSRSTRTPTSGQPPTRANVASIGTTHVTSKEALAKSIGDSGEHSLDSWEKLNSHENSSDRSSSNAGYRASAPPPESESDNTESQNSKQKSSTNAENLSLYYYYLTIGWIKLNDFGKALTSVNNMLVIIPGHKQGSALKEYIEVDMRRSGAVAGAAGLSVLVAVGAVVTGILLGTRSK